LLTLATEKSLNSIVITDLEGNITFVNKTFTQITGYESHEVLGKNPRILKGGYYPSSFYKNLWKTISSGKTWEGEFVNRRKTGEIFNENAVICPIKNKQGRIVSYLGIKQNITELKKADIIIQEKN
jgi:PAS domain S-box-containing protein